MRRFSHWLDGRREGEALSPPIETSAEFKSGGVDPGRSETHLDLFSQLTIERRAAVMDAFNPAHPVHRRGELCGRNNELLALFDALLNQKKHAIVHGSRGTGKTSLVRVFGDYADQRGTIVIYMACEAHTSFGDLMRHYLRFVPSTCVAAEAAEAFQAGVASLNSASRPRDFVELLSRIFNCRVVFILDEFDRVADPQVQGEVATFMKLLSDADISVHLLIVGIARSVSEILACHPSLRRHVTAISVGRISPDDVGVLIDQGAARSGLSFSDPARSLIISISCGSPYHARVFCQEAGLEALSSGRTMIDEEVARAGLAKATDHWTRLNEQDGVFFRKLASAEASVRDRMIEVAKLAAVSEGFTQDVELPPEEPAKLPPSPDEIRLAQLREISRQVFRDSSAPQFFLATVELVKTDDAWRVGDEAVVQHDVPAESAPTADHSVQATAKGERSEGASSGLLQGYGRGGREATPNAGVGRATWANQGRSRVWSVSADWARPRQ